MEVKAEELKFWCEKIVNDPEMLPKKEKVGTIEVETTYCNIAVNRICRAMGYDKLDGMTANQIYDHLKSNSEILDPNSAMKNAEGGHVVIAAQPGTFHGHVAVVWPKLPMVYSGKWSCYVPRVANVGENNGIFGANYAFKDIPEFFKVI